MPRPKPKEQIKGTSIRLTARHQAILKDLGGSVWIRAMLEKHAKMPKKYYEVFERSSNDNRNRELKTGTTTQGAGAR